MYVPVSPRLAAVRQHRPMSVFCQNGASAIISMSASFIFSPEADSLETFRVSDAVRRRKVGGARTRGPLALVYVVLGFGLLWAAAGVAG
ncbi:hypothetical protein DAH56_20010, partial [Sphingomonas koreensis]